MIVRSRFILLLAATIPFLSAACNQYAEPLAPQTDCASDDPRIGRTTQWYADLHGIRGDLSIVDNCTIVIEHFYYDGIALDARIVGMKGDEDCTHGTILTPDIRREGGYVDETFTVTLPEGVTLDDVERIGLCCAPVGFTFTEGTFE